MNNFYDICHDKSVHYSIVSSRSVHRCTVCGRVWHCEIPPFPPLGGKYTPPYWVEDWSWMKFWSALGRRG